MEESISGISLLVMVIMVGLYVTFLTRTSRKWVRMGYTMSDVLPILFLFSIIFFFIVMIVMVMMNGTLCIDGVPVQFIIKGILSTDMKTRDDIGWSIFKYECCD